MKNVQVAFKFLDDESEIPVGFKPIECHIIYDVKFDLTRKARYVGGGHLTTVPASMTYSSVVSRDSVRIMFLIAALNDLDVNTLINFLTMYFLYYITKQHYLLQI